MGLTQLNWSSAKPYLGVKSKIQMPSLLKLSQACCLYREHFVLGVGFSRFAHSAASHMQDVIGIDVGSVNTRTAVMMDGLFPRILETEDGRAISSVVAMEPTLVGRAAKLRALKCPKDVFYNIAHLMGMSFKDPQVQSLIPKVPYKILEGPNGEALVEANGKNLSPTQLLSPLLSRIKVLGEKYLITTKPIKAVVTVPCGFSDNQKKEMQKAVEDAGFELLSIIDDVVAAARCCTNRQNGTVAVYNLGGQFHFSVLEIVDGAITIKSRKIDPFLGGRAFDEAILEHLLEEIKRMYQVDLSKDKIVRILLTEESKRAKIILSSADKVKIDIQHLDRNLHEKEPITLTRHKFETLIKDLVEKTRNKCKEVLYDAGCSTHALDELILVGCMTKIPLVQRTLSELFMIKLSLRWDPAEAAAFGAALHGVFIIEDQKEVLPNSIPLSLGCEDTNGKFTRLIPRGSTLPTRGRAKLGTLSHTQKTFSVRVFQGEHRTAARNVLLGEFNVTLAPALGLNCDLVFECVQDSIVSVSIGNEGLGLNVATKQFQIPEMSEKDVRARVKEAIFSNMVSQGFYQKELRNYEEMVVLRAEMVLQQLKPYLKEHAHYSNMRDAVDKLKNLRDSDLYLHREKLIIDILYWMAELIKMDEAESAR